MGLADARFHIGHGELSGKGLLFTMNWVVQLRVQPFSPPGQVRLVERGHNMALFLLSRLISWLE